jgi:PAS domain S-box-containing protein
MINKKGVAHYRWLMFYVLLLAIVVATGVIATSYLGDMAKQEILNDNEAAISVQSVHLTDELNRIEGGVKALSKAPSIIHALISSTNYNIAQASLALDRYNSAVDASVSYLIDSRGVTIASTNRRDPDSFVGKSYEFRPYFTQAMKGSLGRYFALGVTSSKRGFYASFPVRDAKGKIVGVVTMKKDLDEIEKHLGGYPYFFFANPHGIIFLSSNKEMLLKSLWPIDQETQQALIASKQFGEKPFETILEQEVSDRTNVTFRGNNYLVSRKVIDPEGWSIVLMAPTDRITVYRSVGMITTLLIGTLLIIPLIVNYKTARSAEIVRESEERYRAIFENTGTATVILEEDTTISLANAEFVNLAGYLREEIEGKKRWTEFVVKEDLERMLTQHKLRREETGTAQKSYDFRFVDREGQIKEIHLTIDMIPGTKKSVASLLDMTDRKKAEEALRTEMGFINNLIQASPAFFVAIGADGKIIMMNDSFLNAIGYSHEWVVGKDYLLTIVPERDWDLLSTIFEKLVISHEPSLNENHVLTRDGRELLVEWHGRPVFDDQGNFLYFFGVGIDITDRKRAEEELIESEKAARQLAQENELIAEIGKIISSTLDIDKVYERFAEEVRKVIPIDRISVNIINPKDNTCTNAYISGIELPHRKTDDHYPIAFTVTEEVSLARRSVLINEENYKDSLDRFPGSAEIFQRGLRSLMATPLISEDKVIGALHFRSTKPNIYSDKELKLAERVSYQIAGAIANAQLYREREQAEEKRRSIEERLQRAEKMEALGSLAGGVAHDLNNVLGIVVGYAEMLLLDTDKSSPIRPELLNIMSGGQRAAAIVQDLLTLARRGVSGRKVLNLNKIIADSQQSPEFKNLSSYHPSIRIKADLEPDLLNVSGSSVHLGKTLFNLVSNASEAMPKGGILTIKTANRYLDRPIQGYDEVREGDYVVLSVSDTGEGIPAADLKRIFEPFYTKKVMGRSGTGLGLAVVWGTVKDHNGYINVESEEGKGSTFTLYFPVTREDITAEAAAISISEYMGKDESILVVDDVKGQRDLAAGMLRKLNYNVTTVSSGEEAIAYLKERKIDLLVLDMIMDPGMDGLDTYRSILEIHPKQKAIIVSGFSESDRVHAAQAMGAGAYVRKPYVIEKLGVAVRKELDRK